jgi:mandelate racemase
MSATIPTIRSVKARGIVAPIARPVKNAFGVIEAAPLVLIDVVTDQGLTGRAYIFAYSRLTLAPLVHLIQEIGRDLTGKPIAPFDLMAAMDAKFRLLGWQGLVGMAVSGLDMAFWDALGQAAGKPLAELLGGSLRPIRAMTAMVWSIPSPTRKTCAARSIRGFAASRSRAATAISPMTSEWSKACAL